jgi:hypothetical protein
MLASVYPDAIGCYESPGAPPVTSENKRAGTTWELRLRGAPWEARRG